MYEYMMHPSVKQWKGVILLIQIAYKKCEIQTAHGKEKTKKTCINIRIKTHCLQDVRLVFIEKEYTPVHVLQ